MQAIIFDMDGVLIDSEPLWKIAEVEAFAKVGLNLTYTDCEETVGLRIDQVVGIVV
jgi:beta-phosphoglucomutase-like phosphatase (HAD superfamily)